MNIGTNNFDRVRWEYFRDRQVAFEAFKAAASSPSRRNTPRGSGRPATTSPLSRRARSRRNRCRAPRRRAPQGWYFNLRRDAFKDIRIREALNLCFDFEWTNKNIIFGSYARMTSFFENSDLKAVGKPSPEELALLEPFRGKVSEEVFGDPWLPPISDGSGSDCALMRKADELLRAAGCKREGNVLKLPDGKPFEIEFLDFQPGLQPHTQPFQANLGRLGIKATSRIVDAAQYQRRMQEFDFDIASLRSRWLGHPQRHAADCLRLGSARRRAARAMSPASPTRRSMR